MYSGLIRPILTNLAYYHCIKNVVILLRGKTVQYSAIQDNGIA